MQQEGNKTVTFKYPLKLQVRNEMTNPTSDGLVKKAEMFIQASPHGVSIQEVARHLNVTRYSANGLRGQLIGAGKVGVRTIGPVKVHYWKKEKGGEK